MVIAVRMVRRALQDRGWTQAELVRRMRQHIATDAASVSRWVNGLQVPLHPSANVIEKLLGVAGRCWGQNDPSDAELPKIPERLCQPTKRSKKTAA